MMMKLPKLAMALTIFAMATALSADEKNETPKPISKDASEKARAAANASSPTVDAIMDTAVRNIGRRYNLNSEQLEKTRELMRREVYKFLTDHEDNVWPLIRDLLKVQLGNKPPENIEDVMRIGKGAAPLARLAEKAIVRSNEEWREFLTAEQRVVHDYDMKEMRETFKTINKNFDSWAEGKPSGESIFPGPQTAQAGPIMPPKPKPGLPDPAEETLGESTTLFDAYVAEFIVKYRLDPGQRNAAQSILAEKKDEVAKFRAANYKELAAITQELLAAQKQRDRKKIAEIEVRRKKMLQPVYVLFNEMDGRLHGLLQAGQRERFADKREPKATENTAKNKRDSVKDADARRPSEKRPSVPNKTGGSNAAASPTGGN